MTDTTRKVIVRKYTTQKERDTNIEKPNSGKLLCELTTPEEYGKHLDENEYTWVNYFDVHGNPLKTDLEVKLYLMGS